MIAYTPTVQKVLNDKRGNIEPIQEIPGGEELFRKAYEAKGKWSLILQEQTDDTIQLIKQVRDLQTYKPIGYIRIGLKRNYLDKLVAAVKFDSQGKVIILRSQEVIVGENIREEFIMCMLQETFPYGYLRYEEEGKAYRVFYVYSGTMNWKNIGLISESYINKGLTSLKYTTLFFLEREREELESEMEVLAGMTGKIIAENASTAMDQGEYQRQYDSLLIQYEETKVRHDEVAGKIADKQAQAAQFWDFIATMEKMDGVYDSFDEGIWSSLIEYVTVYSKKTSALRSAEEWKCNGHGMRNNLFRQSGYHFTSKCTRYIITICTVCIFISIPCSSLVCIKIVVPMNIATTKLIQ